MGAGDLQPERIQQQWQARLQGMGLAARPMAGGRCLLVSLPVGSAPFDSIAGAQSLSRIIFATVGTHQIKCLRPRPFFGLPLLDVQECTEAVSIESVIRRAWGERTRQLRDTQRWLGEVGLEISPEENGSMLGFPLAGETPDAVVYLNDRETAILPSAGPLSGIGVEGPEDRLLPLPAILETAADLECLIGAQMDGIRRAALKREASRRKAPTDPARAQPAAPIAGRAESDPEQEKARRFAPARRRVLVVGPQLAEDPGLRDELLRQGFRLETARSETEALSRLAGMTPDLVLSEYTLGRSDGATLVQTTRSLPGIEGMPVVLLDDAKHESRKQAARAVGAAGYVVLPHDKSRFVARLGKLLGTPGQRRYTRYPQRLAARLEDYEIQCLATQVGRGGVFITMAEEIDLNTAMRGEVMLPELGRPLRFDGEVLYRTEGQGDWPGLGLRFQSLSPEDEAALIEYVTWLESRR